MKEKADELMAFEEEKWNNERQAEMLRKEHQYTGKLAQEAEALKRRIGAGRSEQSRQRQLELERLLQRYHNVKHELALAHKIERQKIDRDIQMEHAARANRAASAAASAAAAAKRRG
jgi:hypothetical protein